MKHRSIERRGEADPLVVLRQVVAGYPNQRKAAAALGITQAYLSDLLHGRRLFSERMLAILGLRRVVVSA